MQSNDVELLSNTFHLNIHTVDNFESLKPKMGGTRPGAIGKYKGDDRLYMLKIEMGGYANKIVGNIRETACIESLTAQLIRSIWGADYAADIHIAEINQSVPTLFLKDQKYELKINKLMSKYCVSSVWVDSSRPVKEELNNNSFYYRLTELHTIAKVLGVSDLKLDHLLYNEVTKNIFLVDCAANFRCRSALLFDKKYSMVTLNNELVPQAVINTMQKFISYPYLESILGQYKMLSDRTAKMILTEFKESQAICEKILKQYSFSKQQIPASFFYIKSDTEYQFARCRNDAAQLELTNQP